MEKSWRVTVGPYRKARSNDQNAFLWMTYQTILDSATEELRGWTKDDLHEFFLIDAFGAETIDGFGRKRLKPIKRSSKLTTTEFMDYVAHIQQFMAERGLYLPDPNEENRMTEFPDNPKEKAMDDKIDVSAIAPEKLLAGLYNSARQQGMGFLNPAGAQPMTEEDARRYLEANTYKERTYVDYLQGRVMKVEINGQTLDSALYDRDNGTGAAARVVKSLK